MTELAVTEHLFRFRQADALVGGFWDDERVPPALAESMAEYWKFHATADLDAYVECAQAAKEAGLPVVIGLEVDYYEGRMDTVADLLAGYPFDVLLGSVHWVGGWRFDDLDDPVSMAEWSTRRGRRLLGGLHRGARGAGRVGRLRRAGPPGPHKGGGPRARRAGRVVGPDRRGGRGLGHGGRGQLGRLAQAGGRAVPGPGPARALRGPRGAADHGLGRAPPRARRRPGRRPARRAGGGGGRRAAGLPHQEGLPGGGGGGGSGPPDADARRAGPQPHRPQARGARAPAAAARELERPGRPLLLRPASPGARARRGGE